jgi:hypothetical protein
MALRNLRDHFHFIGVRGKQTGFGQGIDRSVEFNTNGRMWPLNAFTFPNLGTNRQHRHDVAFGDGAGWRHEVDELMKNYEFVAPFEMESDVAIAYLALALGAISTAGTGADFANRYIHTIKHQTGFSRPLTAVAFSDNIGNPRVYQDLAVTSLRFGGSKPAGNACTLSVGFRGSGFVDNGGFTLPSPVRNKKSRMSNFSFLFGTFSSEVEIAALINSWELAIEWTLDETHNPGTDGVIGNTADASNRPTVRLSLNFRKDSTDSVSLKAIYEGDPNTDANLRSAIINMKGEDHAETSATSARQVTLTLPQLVVMAPNQNEADNKQHWDLQMDAVFDENGTGYSAGNDGPIVATGDNGTDSTVYLQDLTDAV